MKILKIITVGEDIMKPFMNESMSFNEGIIEVVVGWDMAKEMGASILNHKMRENRYWIVTGKLMEIY